MTDDQPLKRVALGDFALPYLEVGHGEPLVLVHGSLGDYRSWRRQLDAFAAHYRVIAYSRRYHYPSRWPGAGPEYSPRLHAADLARLIEALELAPCYIVGASYG